MAYVLPQVLVFQDFQIVPGVVANPLNAHIVGPNGDLIRFSESDERENGFLGYYDHLLDTVYPYPTKPAGSIVDQSFFKLWMSDALLQYFEDTVAGGSAITTVSGKKNQIISDAVSFASNGAAYPHSATELLDRGVKVGDIAKVRVVPAVGDPETLWTYVKGFIGDVIASTAPATGTADADNQTVIAASSNVVTQTAGVDNCIDLTADESSYDGIGDGGITETYTVVVTASSTGGDLTTGRLRVISASGNDDQSNVTPGAEGAPFAIGTRGLTITLTDNDAAPCQAAAAAAGVTSNDLIAGQTWTIAVEQQYATVPTVNIGGSYTGQQDTTYIIEVLRGGTLLDSSIDMPVPVLLGISTNNGYDSGTLEVHLEDTAYAFGNYGLTLEFTENEILLGDRWAVAVTAQKSGAYKTIILGHNWQGAFDEEPADLTLFIRKPELQIGEHKTEAPPNVNYEITANNITVKSAVTAFDSEWTDNGVPQALEVLSESSKGYGKLYAEYRLWLADKCSGVFTIGDVGTLDTDIPGPLDPDNPLKWAVFKALSNSNGVPVRFTAICDENDTDEWAAALGLLLERDDVYGLVPLTRNRVVQDLFAAHVDAQSAAEQGLWRVCWFSLQGIPTIPIVHAGSQIPGHTLPTTTDGNTALATVEDDPGTAGTQYTRLIVPAGNAQFETNGARAKDVVRINFGTNAFGVGTYEEYQIDQVVNEDELILATGLDSAINTPVKMEVWRNLSSVEESSEIASDAGAWGNRRVRAVWPDTIESSGTIQEGYHVCAALAGLASGVLPHQGMTNLEVAGFSDVARTTSKFTRTDLNKMAEAGVFIVTQAVNGGDIYSRHAVTTGDYEDINKREEMLTRNVDSMSYRFKAQYEPFIGISNVSPQMTSLLGVETQSLIDLLKTESITTRLGAQLIDAEIIELRPHILFKDRIVITLRLTIPYPLNVIEVNLVI